MLIRPLLFANLRQLAGTDHLELEVPNPISAGELLHLLAQRFPQLRLALPICRVAIDQEFVAEDFLISAEMEIALIPPVSGGHDGYKTDNSPNPRITSEEPRQEVQIGNYSRLSYSVLCLVDVHAEVEHEHAGGVTSFVGNVRAKNLGRSIQYLDYEAYGSMALRAMDQIVKNIETAMPGTRVRIHHRLGRLGIGDTAVVIAASAPHREEAFQACRQAIERLKSDVPIWKYEVDDQGGTWIGSGP